MTERHRHNRLPAPRAAVVDLSRTRGDALNPTGDEPVPSASHRTAIRSPCTDDAPPSRRLLTALLLSLAACRPAGRSEAAPPPATPGATGTIACEDPAAAFARFAWLPAEVRSLVSVHLQDDRLPAALDTLENFAQGPFIHDAPWTNFAAELPELRALLTAAKLSPPEAVYFVAGADIGVWVVPGSCEPDNFAQLAAALELEVQQPPGPITIATGRRPHALVQLPSGGPLWIARADDLAPLLTWLEGSAGTWACCGQNFRDDRPDATVRVFLVPDPSTFRQYSVTGADLFMSGHTSFNAVVDK